MGDDTSYRATPPWPGTSGPETATPPRAAGGLRRTTSLDAVRSPGPRPRLFLIGRGRDLRTRSTSVAGTAAGDVVHTARLSLAATIERRDITVATATAHPDALDGLAGAAVGAGFRRRARAALPRGLADQPLATLLEDVPAVALISRSGPFRTGERPVREQRHPPLDVCAGWRTDGVLHVRSGTDDALVGRGPTAPALRSPGDGAAWHPLPSVAPGTFRRVRRIDLAPSSPGDGELTVDAMFRDTFVEADGTQSVIHEYRFTGTVDAGSRALVALTAHPGVLPGPECSGAAASVDRLVGRTLDDVAASVRRDLAGTVGCTHLTDAVHALASAAALLEHLGRSQDPEHLEHPYPAASEVPS